MTLNPFVEFRTFLGINLRAVIEQPPTNNSVKDVPVGLNQNIATRWQILSMQSRGGYKNRGQREEWPNLNVF